MILCVDQARQALSGALGRFEVNYLIHKKFYLPVDSLQAPGPDIANRQLDMDHVKKLRASFRTYQRINEDVMVVARTHHAGPKAEHLTVEWLQQHAKKIEVIAGHHSVEAVKLLHHQFPDTELFAKVPCKVFVCPDTSENRQYLRAIGGFDNLIKAIQRRSSKTEITLQIRRHLECEIIPLPDKDKPRKLRDLKEHWAAIYNLNKATLGTIIVLANKPPEIWALIEQLLTGKEMFPGYRPPSNPSAFNQIGGLDSEWIVKELKKLKAGDITLSVFHANCLREKNRLKVIEWIRELIVNLGSKRPSHELEFMKWKSICGLYPLTTQPDFIASLCSGVSMIPKKSGPPESFKRAVSDWIKMDESVRRDVLLFPLSSFSSLDHCPIFNDSKESIVNLCFCSV